MPPITLESPPAPLDIVVLLGGWSSEREVSLVSGREVVNALTSLGHKVRAIDVTRDALTLMHLLTNLTPKPDVVYNALHGKGGEDGTVQAMLEWLDIPYTHSGVAPSAVAMNKDLTKKLVSTVGIRTPEGEVVPSALVASRMSPERAYVVKPVTEGSSVGVLLVQPGKNSAITADKLMGDYQLVEEYIPGRELTVGVADMLAGGQIGEPVALGVTEIDSSGSFFDYTSKYTAGHARHILPAPVPPEVAEAAKAMALGAHKVLGCTGITRSDFRYDDSKPGTSGLYFLEINTQPGFTPLSLLPEQAAALGFSFAAVANHVVAVALAHHRRKQAFANVA